MSETPDARLKRMRMRSWRRGTKEMDLILGPFADAQLSSLDPESLDLYDTLLAENDQDLIGWMLGQTPPPPRFTALVARISSHAGERLGPRG